MKSEMCLIHSASFNIEAESMCATVGQVSTHLLIVVAADKKRLMRTKSLLNSVDQLKVQRKVSA